MERIIASQHPQRGQRTAWGHTVHLSLAIVLVCTAASAVRGQRTLQELHPPGSAGGGLFGSAVAVDGDVLMVGRQDGYYADVVYVFRYDEQTLTWVYEQWLPDDPNSDFGAAVSVSGNLALVGAPRDDWHFTDSGTVFGCAYLYPVWGCPLPIRPSDAAAYDSFGQSVSISGEIAAIGSPGDDDAGAESGSAYVFRYHADAYFWTEICKLLASDGAPGDRFGEGVAFDGEPYRCTKARGAAPIRSQISAFSALAAPVPRHHGT